jgi:hypothetical protein
MCVDRILKCLVLVASAICSGCIIVPKPSPQELQALDTPPTKVTEKIDRLFPRALAWYETVEAELLPKGRPLSNEETETARRFGVHDPTKVRVIQLESFPMPTDAELLTEARRYGLGNRSEGGRANGYGIMLKPRLADDKRVIAHELVHVGQHDRMGRAAFLRRYLIELEMMGYTRSPLELEAYEKQRQGQ